QTSDPGRRTSGVRSRTSDLGLYPLRLSPDLKALSCLRRYSEWTCRGPTSEVRSRTVVPCKMFPAFHAMQELEEPRQIQAAAPAVLLPVSVIVPVPNEAHNLSRCLESLRGVGEVYVVDSASSDGTAEIARSFGAKVVQFHYAGGWPKKRQWAMDTLNFSYDWILLVDADESVTPELWREIQRAIRDSGTHGFYVALDLFFLGRRLRHSGATFHKLALFRRGKGRFECRT